MRAALGDDDRPARRERDVDGIVQAGDCAERRPAGADQPDGPRGGVGDGDYAGRPGGHPRGAAGAAASSRVRRAGRRAVGRRERAHLDAAAGAPAGDEHAAGAVDGDAGRPVPCACRRPEEPGRTPGRAGRVRGHCPRPRVGDVRGAAGTCPRGGVGGGERGGGSGAPLRAPGGDRVHRAVGVRQHGPAVGRVRYEQEAVAADGDGQGARLRGVRRGALPGGEGRRRGRRLARRAVRVQRALEQRRDVQGAAARVDGHAVRAAARPAQGRNLDRAQVRAAGTKDVDGVGRRVGYVQLAGGADGHAGRREQPARGAGLRYRGRLPAADGATRAEHEDSPRVALGHVHAPVGADGHAGRPVHGSGAGARLPAGRRQLAGRLPSRAEHRDAPRRGIGHEQVARGVGRHAVRRPADREGRRGPRRQTSAAAAGADLDDEHAPAPGVGHEHVGRVGGGRAGGEDAAAAAATAAPASAPASPRHGQRRVGHVGRGRRQRRRLCALRPERRRRCRRRCAEGRDKDRGCRGKGPPREPRPAAAAGERPAATAHASPPAAGAIRIAEIGAAAGTFLPAVRVHLRPPPPRTPVAPGAARGPCAFRGGSGRAAARTAAGSLLAAGIPRPARARPARVCAAGIRLRARSRPPRAPLDPRPGRGTTHAHKKLS